MLDRFVQTLVGSVVLFVAFWVMMGNLGDVLTFLFFAVICTAGLSLIILVPLAWGVGWITLEVLRGLGRLLPSARPT